MASSSVSSSTFHWPTPRSAYVHVPFCRHRCGYCNFSVVAGRDDLADSFLDALETELNSLGHPREIDTLFVGGGTPTHLRHTQLHRLFDLLDHWLPRKQKAAPECEVSVEANPEDIDEALLFLLKHRGVNRISLGVQSFQPRKLTLLERSHSPSRAIDAITQSADVIGNVSLDLIFAAPEESTQQWGDDLATALSLPIRHLSTYALTFEKGTSFWNQRLKGRMLNAHEDDELQMYVDAIAQATAAGLEHYEISNFAAPGFRCQHNVAYWHGRGWYAFGPGAARFVDGRREVNHRSPTTYIRKVLAGQSAVAESELISITQYACERAAFGIRMLDGVDLATIEQETGVDIRGLRQDGLAHCKSHQWIDVRGGHYRLTASGILMADSVASALLG